LIQKQARYRENENDTLYLSRLTEAERAEFTRLTDTATARGSSFAVDVPSPDSLASQCAYPVGDEIGGPIPVLKKPQREEFAVAVASGLRPAQAYIQAGYSPNGARQGAHLLLKNLAVSARVLELRTQMSNHVKAGIVVREIAQANARLAELQYRWDTARDALDCLMEERGAALADEAAGGSSGLLVKLYSHGKAIYKIDGRVLDLIRLLLKIDREACGPRSGPLARAAFDPEGGGIPRERE
jgi:hypothetical protein